MPKKTKTPQNKTKTSTPTGGGILSSGTPAGGMALTVSPGGFMAAGAPPAGLFASALAMGADASDEMLELAPAFGDILLSIGTGVADSQDALDKGLVNTAQLLSENKITYVSEVVQELNEDGLPDPAKTELIQNDVSLINFVNPTVHEWKHVAISMDMNVGEMDNERGVTFKKKQYDVGYHAAGLLWGFIGWFDTDERTTTRTSTSRVNQESDWASGQVRLDAMMGPRRMDAFPVPGEVTVGPQIYFSQGAVSESQTDGVVTSRSIDIVIKVLKSNGDVNPSVNIEVDPDRYSLSYAEADGFTGSMTNAEGEVRITLTRNIPNVRFRRSVRSKITAQLGQMSKIIEINL